MIFYDLALALFALVSFPKILVQKKYRNSFLFKLGLKLPTISSSDKRTVIWIHAVSLGETKSSLSLAKELKYKYPQHTLILSTATETGLEEAKKYSFFDEYFLLPLDFSFTMKRLVKKIHPSLLILIEGDYWYNLQSQVKKIGGKIALVSGKISEKSLRRFLYFPLLARKLFGQIDIFCLQDEIMNTRFRSLGIDKKKIHLTGNLKLSPLTHSFTQAELATWKAQFSIEQEAKVITLASTHYPEEELLLEKIEKVKEPFSLKIFLVPRHPERFAEVEKYLKEKKYSYISLSKISRSSGNEKIILVDRMGFLPICYRLSNLTIVGGSFISKVGGHNLIEPAIYSSPSFFGPHTWAQKPLQTLVENYHVGGEVLLEDLPERISSLLTQDQQVKLKENCSHLKSSLDNVVKKTVNILSLHLSA